MQPRIYVVSILLSIKNYTMITPRDGLTETSRELEHESKPENSRAQAASPSRKILRARARESLSDLGLQSPRPSPSSSSEPKIKIPESEPELAQHTQKKFETSA